jgi:type I restriction enzyme S subunit
MEVKSGYKHTEVGVIPEDWEVKRLGDLGTTVRGGSPRPAGDPRYFNGNFIPWLTVGSLTNIPSNQLFVTDTATKLTEEGAKHSRTLQEGTLVIVNSGARTLGVSKVLAITCCANDGIAALVGQSAGEKRFLCFFLNSQIQRLRQVVAAGNDQLNLNTGRIALIAVPFPKETEQHAIATALSDVDGLLGGLDRIIAKKRDIKQAIMQQLLSGKTRLQGFYSEWEVKTLGDIANILKGSALSKSAVTASGRRPCILYGELFTISGRVISEVKGYTNSSEGFPSVSGDVLMPGSTTTTGVDLATASALLLDDVALGGDILIIRQRRDAYDPVFLANYLTHLRSHQIAELTQGITIHHLYGRDLKNLLLELPSLPEQTAITRVLTDMDAELAALRQQRQKVFSLKQAMMQELLTGRIRLVAPTASAPEKSHNWAINEAVVIAILVKHFADERFPLGRKRCTKLSYLLHRRVEHTAQGYLKKAAGPYNPAVKYRGPEKIAQENGYIRPHKNGNYSGYIVADKIAQAEGYFEKWYGCDVLPWLEQFRLKTNDELELLATVDMAMQDLKTRGDAVDLKTVKEAIYSHPEWKAKLSRPAFCDNNIERAIAACRKLFSA